MIQHIYTLERKGASAPSAVSRAGLLLERFALLVLKAIHSVLQWRPIVNLVRPKLRDASTQSSSSKGANCPLRSKPRIRRQNRVNKGSFWCGQRWPTCSGTRLPWERGQRRNFSSTTKVLSMIFAAAQHLDASCADCWNRAVRFGRPDLLEVCAHSDSPLVEAVESAGGQDLRTSFWNGYDLTTRRGRERLHLFC